MVKYAISELKEKKVADLKIIAKKVCGAGVSKMKKDDLIANIMDKSDLKKTPVKAKVAKSPKASPKKKSVKKVKIVKSPKASPKKVKVVKSPKVKRVIKRKSTVVSTASPVPFISETPIVIRRPKTAVKTYKPRPVVRKSTTTTVVMSPLVMRKKIMKSRKSVRKSVRKSSTRMSTSPHKSMKRLTNLKPKTRKMRKISTEY
jgi:hypothetical protein